jgi:serine/threonine protein kinase
MPLSPSLSSFHNPKVLHIVTNPGVTPNSTNNENNDSNAPDQGNHRHLLIDPERRHQDQEQGRPGPSSIATALPSEPDSSLADDDMLGTSSRKGDSSPLTIDKLSGSFEDTLNTSHSKFNSNSNSNSNSTSRELESSLPKSLASTLPSVHENLAHVHHHHQQQEQHDSTEFTGQTDRLRIAPHTTTMTSGAVSRPHISIDTSPVALQRRRSPSSVDPLPFAHHNQQATSKSSSAAGSNSYTPSQLSIGLATDIKTNANPPTSIHPSSIPKVLPTPSATPSTPPKRRMSLTWNLPPGHLKEISPSSQRSSNTHSGAAPIISPPLTDDQDLQSTSNNNCTPNIPINRYRSKSFSSSVNSDDSYSSTFSVHRSNSLSSKVLVTSSSYNSLPYSPAVAFLSNFVDVTAPEVSLDEEGAQVGDYLLGRVIGHGGFSIVREATSVQMDQSGQVDRVAVKIVKTQTGAADNDRVQKMLRKEIAIWSQISHPHVLPFLMVVELPTNTFIFCELCTGGHLLNYLSLRSDALPQLTTPTTPGSAKPLEEDEARVIFNQVAEAVRYLHEEKRIVHRDIKLENILRYDDATWKICDFGLAEYQDEDAAACFGESFMSPTESVIPPLVRPKCDGAKPAKSGQKEDKEKEKVEEEDMCGGSLAYCSPEQLRSHKPLRCPSSDVWSLGVVLYALLTGRLPFQDEYEPRLQHQILNGRYDDPVECSAEARDLVKNMFRSKPQDRWRIGQVKDSAWCLDITDHSLGGAGGEGGGGSSRDQMSNILSSFRSTL